MYNNMEQVLQLINKNYISLTEEEIKRNNEILTKVLDSVIKELKETSELFKMMYSTLLFSGSYYDGLKVGKPNEFDIDLIMELPKIANPQLTGSDIPGFAYIQLNDFDKFQKQPEAKQYKGLNTLLDDNHFLETNKFSSWFESILNKALKKFPTEDNLAYIEASDGCLILIMLRKSGPAFTLQLEKRDINKSRIDIDLVPSLQFTQNKWLPEQIIRKNPTSKKPNFFLVPKKPKNEIKNHRYWRLSFPEQEQALLNDTQNVKPSIRIIKKLRDMENHKLIASYYIKTIFLQKIFEDKSCGKKSLSDCLMMMLRIYSDNLKDGKILNFWVKEDNLLKNINKEALTNMANRISAIISDIEKNQNDPLRLAKYLISNEDIIKLKNELNL